MAAVSHETYSKYHIVGGKNKRGVAKNQEINGSKTKKCTTVSELIFEKLISGGTTIMVLRVLWDMSKREIWSIVGSGTKFPYLDILGKINIFRYFEFGTPLDSR